MYKKMKIIKEIIFIIISLFIGYLLVVFYLWDYAIWEWTKCQRLAVLGSTFVIYYTKEIYLLYRR